MGDSRVVEPYVRLGRRQDSLIRRSRIAMTVGLKCGQSGPGRGRPSVRFVECLPRTHSFRSANPRSLHLSQSFGLVSSNPRHGFKIKPPAHCGRHNSTCSTLDGRGRTSTDVLGWLPSAGFKPAFTLTYFFLQSSTRSWGYPYQMSHRYPQNYPHAAVATSSSGGLHRRLRVVGASHCGPRLQLCPAPHRIRQFLDPDRVATDS